MADYFAVYPVSLLPTIEKRAEAVADDLLVWLLTAGDDWEQKKRHITEQLLVFYRGENG